jgi:hypothetical protein
MVKAMERLVVQVAPGKFDVIEGRQLNDRPLTRAEADRLAKGSSVSAAPPHEKGASQGPPLPAAQSTPQPAPAVDLRATGWDQAGGSCGFRIKGGPTW